MAKVTVKDIPDSLMTMIEWEGDTGKKARYFLPKPIVDLMKAKLTVSDLQAYKVRNDPPQSVTV